MAILTAVIPQDLSTTASPTFVGLNLTGLINDVLLAANEGGLRIDGDSNPFVYSASFGDLNYIYRTIEGTGAIAPPALGIHFDRKFIWDYDFSGSSNGWRTKQIYNDGAQFIFSGNIDINTGALNSISNKIGANFSALQFSGDFSNSTARSFSSKLIGGYFLSYIISDFNITGAGSCTLDIIAGYFCSIYNAPTITLGSPILNYYGGYFEAEGTDVGTSTSYGGYFSGTGSNTNYDIYAANTASLNILAGNTRIGSTVAPTVALDVTGAALISLTLGVTGLSTLTGGISIPLAEDIQFRDSNTYIYSSSSGNLDLVASGEIRFCQVTADTDITVRFVGTTNQGVLNWFEDEDYFRFFDDLLIYGDEKIQFRDTAIFVNSINDGYLDLTADSGVRINASLTIGSASTNDISCVGRLRPRDLNGDPTAGGGMAGTRGEICYDNTTEKIWLKTVDSGTNTNWVALN